MQNLQSLFLFIFLKIKNIFKCSFVSCDNQSMATFMVEKNLNNLIKKFLYSKL